MVCGAARRGAGLRYAPARLFSAREIATPLLLMHTDLDIAGFPANMRDQWSRIFAWYDKYLELEGWRR